MTRQPQLDHKQTYPDHGRRGYPKAPPGGETAMTEIKAILTDVRSGALPLSEIPAFVLWLLVKSFRSLRWKR